MPLVQEIGLFDDNGFDLRAAERRLRLLSRAVGLHERESAAALQHARNVRGDRLDALGVVQRIHREDHVEYTGPKRYVAHVRANAMIKNAECASNSRPTD